MGRVDDIGAILEDAGIGCDTFLDVEPDPPVELIERAGDVHKTTGCDGINGVGGGSNLDAAKAIALRITYPGELSEYESIVVGTAKIKPILLPPDLYPHDFGNRQ